MADIKEGQAGREETPIDVRIAKKTGGRARRDKVIRNAKGARTAPLKASPQFTLYK